MIKTCMSEAVSSEQHDTTSVAELFSWPFIEDITHVAVGMGLGRDDWSLEILRHCVRLNRAMLIDADALNLLADHRAMITEITASSVALVITPHPGEAARLLSSDAVFNTADVQSDRFRAIKKLYELFGVEKNCVVVLKGSGTLLFDGDEVTVCGSGTAAMATPGMGDTLSGIIIALLAQNIADGEPEIGNIVELGVCLHAMAAERVSCDKTRGLLASDVIEALSEVLQ